MTYRARASDGTLLIDGTSRIFGLDGRVGGLVADYGEDLATILTGVNLGPVTISAYYYDADPGASAFDEWEEVVEVSVEADGSGLDGFVVVGFWDERTDDVVKLDGGGEGWYRLRVSARGRGIEYDQVVTEPVESYLIEAWLQEPSLAAVLKTIG